MEAGLRVGCDTAQLMVNGEAMAAVRQGSFVYETVTEDIPDTAWGIYGSHEALRRGEITWILYTLDQLREAEWIGFTRELSLRLDRLLKRR
jgi:hypothetical protein